MTLSRNKKEVGRKHAAHTPHPGAKLRDMYLKQLRLIVEVFPVACFGEYPYFTQLIYESLKVINRERLQQKTKENADKYKL